MIAGKLTVLLQYIIQKRHGSSALTVAQIHFEVNESQQKHLDFLGEECQTHLKSTEVVIMFLLWRKQINSAFKRFVTLPNRRENVCGVWKIEWHLLAVRKLIILEILSDMMKFSSLLIASHVISFLFACLNLASKSVLSVWKGCYLI